MRFRLSALIVFLFLHVQHSVSQGCCTVGASSLGGFNRSVLPEATLAVSADYQYNSLTQAYTGTENIEDPLRRTAEVAYFTLRSEFGLQPRLSILASLYYSDKSRELTVQSGQGSASFEETAKFRGSGIGDLTLLAKYQMVRSTVASPFGLAIGGGASLPTGSYTEEQDGSQLSIDLQPGTGATTLIGWSFATYDFLEIGLHTFLMGMYRYAGPNLDGYRIGDEILANIGIEKSIGEYFSASLLIRSRFANEDFAGGRFLTGTGGTYHDLMGGIAYSEGASTVRIVAQIPLYRNVRGIQLTTTYMLGVEYRYTVDI